MYAPIKGRQVPLPKAYQTKINIFYASLKLKLANTTLEFYGLTSKFAPATSDDHYKSIFEAIQMAVGANLCVSPYKIYFPA